jgi:nucleoside-diphosphate-sugar epimerase
VSVPAHLDRVVVTGGTGFIGRHVVRALRERGSHVRVLVRRGAGDATPKVSAPEGQGAELVEAELTDSTAVERALEGATALIHLAGRLLKGGVPDEEYARVHVEATRSVLDACAHVATLRAIVHCSTTGVLGPTGPRPACEDAPHGPSNVYERTKAEGERVALAIAERHGLRLNVARPALVYGPGDLHLASWFRSIRSGYYRVVGTGDSLLHPVYVDDLVDGMLRCAEAPARRVYHLVGERPVPIREIAEAIARALGRRLPRGRIPRGLALAVATALEALPGVGRYRLPLTRSRVAFMTESRAYCGCRARSELGFEPRVDLATGLRRTVEWYRAEGLV